VFILLDGKGKAPSSKTNRCLLAACAPESERDAGESSSFEGIFTNDDAIMAHLDSFMKGRCKGLIFTPPFGSHGAARLRSEQQAPVLPRAE
jgi:hypothetical protein